MKILFDINHPVDVNFFKNAILNLNEKGHEIEIIFRERGKLEKILRYELPAFPITKVGKHKKGFINKVVSQLQRDNFLVSFLKKNDIGLVVCFGPTSAISAKYCKIPYLAFDDDFEYKIPFYHANLFSTRHIFPDFIKYSNEKTYKYHGFKELAYLHPKYLKVSENVLKEYSLKPNKYVFIREIDNVSLNYKDENLKLGEIIEEIKAKGLVVVLSLENKNKKDMYENDCVILEEPVTDIYSLLYFSLFSISSGDTVARETALMGVPTFYTGGRSMVVNDVLIESGLMYESADLQDVLGFIHTISLDKKNKTRKMSIKLIKEQWVDTTNIILKNINDFKVI